LSVIILGFVIVIWSNNVLPPRVLQECCLTPDCVNNDYECETDYVIAGVGSAGSIVTEMLSRSLPNTDKRFSVIALEEGQYALDDIPVKYALDQRTGFDFWLFVPATLAEYSTKEYADPDPGVRGWKADIRQGKQVGGTGNVDYCFIVYPSRKLTEKWAAIGGEKWNYDNIIRIIKQYEKFNNNINSPWPHGNDGPIHNLPQNSSLELDDGSYAIMQKIILSSPADNGITTIVDDYNGDYETSFTQIPQFFWKELEPNLKGRSSPGIEFLNKDVINDKGFGQNGRKLRVVPNANVNKLLIDENKRAYAVEVSVNGKTKIFHARKQIIVSTGGIHTPGILERSGVGNANLLLSLNIPVIHDFPEVGENFQHHTGSQFIFSTNAPVAQRFVSTHGLLSILPENDGLRSMQLILSGDLPGFDLPPNLQNALGLSTLEEGFKPISIILTILQPKSRGSVHIPTKEPSRWPSINTAMYTDTDNADYRLINETFYTIYNAIKLLRASSNFTYNMHYPPEEAFSDPVLMRKSIIDFVFTQAHWSSTCSMGSVVDGNLQLKGVSGVTIADLSVLEINNGNTRTQAMITGVQAAEHLLSIHTP
jgi:choline dehydrogenase